MLLDVKKDISENAVLYYDICIIGAGAAGITIANELKNSNLSVCLLESGGLEPDYKTQGLYEGKNIGLPYFELDTSRLRYFGGSTNHWAGMCAPLDPIDFEKRDWVKHSGWPISYSDLEEYYEQAQEICDLGPYEYNSSFWHGPEHYSLKFNRFFEDKIWQYSKPTKFGEKYLKNLEESGNIQVLMNSNVTDFITNENKKHISKIKISTIDGKKFSINAGRYILACGGIENARILLNSDIANSSDAVGRYFMEHPHIDEALEMVHVDEKPLSNLYKRGVAKDTEILACIGLSPEMQNKYKLHNSVFKLTFHGTDLHKGQQNSAKELSQLNNSKGKLQGTCFWRFRPDQTPNPESRITLSSEKDSLGQNKVELNWQLDELDKHSLIQSTKLAAIEIAASGLGRARMAAWLEDDPKNWPGLRGGHHHTGTTKMGDSPRTSVVDKNCKTHDIDNLYIAGSSTFTTGGWVNPTLTIVAMSIRLAKYLKGL